MDKQLSIKTKYEFVPNPLIIQFQTNWNIQNQPALKIIIESMDGIEFIMPHQWFKKYEFYIEIAELFDRNEVAQAVLAKVEKYFAD